MEKKEEKTSEQELLLKSISDLLDETIKEVETLSKGEVNFSDLKLQPDEQGDMAGIAKQPSDDAAGLKKEDEKLPEELEEKVEDKEEEKKDDEDEKEEEPEVEKAIPEELSEAKDDEDKDEPKKDDEDEEELGKFCKMLEKAMFRLGYIAKSEEAVVEEEVLAKSEEEEEAVDTRDEEVASLKKSVEDLTKTVKELSARPVSGRKSLSGLAPIAKSADDSVGGQPLAKGQVINKLLDLQKSGDKRVNPMLVTKFEQTGDMELVKGLI